ncbi:tetratricopeptide repeat protein, partial [bacterium]|nr:tetratricopeptide repeat protein [bacterium]
SGLYIKEGQYDKALNYAKSDFTKIKAYLMQGENQLAFDMLEKVQDTQNANYPALMAEYYFNIKDYDKCSEWVEKFNELSPQNPLVYQMKALICDAHNDDYGYHYNMGKCYSYNQNYELALAEYLSAHRYDDKQAGAIKEIIKINEASGDKTSLMEFYEKLVRQEPDNTFALKGLGDIFADMYEFKDALKYYKKIAELSPNNYEINFTIGACYEKLKNTAAAKEYYEKYLAKAPLSPDTEKLKEKLQKMVVSSPTEPDKEEEGFIDKIMRFFGK